MNTFRIYEDLRSSLGEEAAKSLAHTLGPMFEELGNTVTKAEFRELTASVDRLAEAQDRTEAQVAKLAAAQGRTDARVAQLAEAQGRTDARVVQLAEAQARTETRVAQLAEAQGRTEAQVAKLAEAQTRTDAQVFELTKVVQSLVIQGERQGARLDAVLGSTFELQFRDRLTSYLGRLMRRGKLLRNNEVLDAIEQSVEPDEADEVLRVDAIASGIVDGIASHVVVEVSATCGADDIDRAARRAGILRKAGLAAVPLVACRVISPELRSYAISKQVRIWCDGTILDAAA
jgi:multidrug efflux pump subunit AcrA (membrane-fusion protein)